MKFLVTNDDGIGSVFLHELVRALLHDGHEVTVAAPKREQSWIGAAKSRHRPVTSERDDATYGLACPTWIVDGTPSDCVNIALAHLLPGAHLAKPDAVVSGINIGFNASLGFILASGTIGGAWEGAVQKISATHAARLAATLTASTPARSFTVHNLNFPASCTTATESRRTVPAR